MSSSSCIQSFGTVMEAHPIRARCFWVGRDVHSSDVHVRMELQRFFVDRRRFSSAPIPRIEAPTRRHLARFLESAMVSWPVLRPPSFATLHRLELHHARMGRSRKEMW